MNEIKSNGEVRQYRGEVTAVENGKGVLDVDTVKGCSCGMASYPSGGCYGECYANKAARRYGIDFSTVWRRDITLGELYEHTITRAS